MSKFYKDLLERVAWTAIQAFLGALVVTGNTNYKAAAVAAVAAAISVIKGVAATKVGDPESAATLK